MNVREALYNRASTRAFLDRPVEREKIVRLLEAARYSPSGANTQPWQVAVVCGAMKQALQQSLEAAFVAGEKPAMDYRYYPETWPEPYKKRRIQCGQQLYTALGIARQDRQRRLEQWKANYRAFGAPVVLYFFMDAGLATGSYMDYGMFLQSIMLAAVEEGLATCPQAALAEYPERVKTVLGYPQDSILICGMAIGYKDPGAAANSYRTPRQPVEQFTTFFSTSE